MWNWSLSFITRGFDADGHLTIIGQSALVVSSLNMLIQVFLSLLFGEKGVLKVGGKR